MVRVKVWNLFMTLQNHLVLNKFERTWIPSLYKNSPFQSWTKRGARRVWIFPVQNTSQMKFWNSFDWKLFLMASLPWWTCLSRLVSFFQDDWGKSTTPTTTAVTVALSWERHIKGAGSRSRKQTFCAEQPACMRDVVYKSLCLTKWWTIKCKVGLPFLSPEFEWNQISCQVWVVL